LEIAGSAAYINIANTTSQTVAQQQPFYLSNELLKHEMRFNQGSYELKVEQSGVYDLFATIATNEPLQLTVYVNGVPVSSTNFGRDSGASRCYVRQFIALKRGDCVSVHNFLTASATVTTVSSGNGAYVSNNLGFALFKMNPNCDPRPCPPPCIVKKRK
jgi:hypothetical protein